MSLIPDVKCSRCDHLYSGITNKCPHCGARRMKKGKRVGEPENVIGRRVVAVVLFLILVASIAAFVVGAGKERTKRPEKPDNTQINTQIDEGASSSDTDSGQQSSSDSSEDTGSSSSDGQSSVLSPNSGTTGSEVQSVVITYLGAERDDITMTVGEEVPLGFNVTPVDVEASGTWSSGDTAVFTINREGRMTAVGVGETEVTVTVGGVTGKCTIRVTE